MTDPGTTPLVGMLEERFESCRSLTAGARADDIPELAKADPAWFGIVLARRLQAATRQIRALERGHATSGRAMRSGIQVANT